MRRQRETFVAAVACVLGTSAFIKTQLLTAESFKPLVEACSVNDSVSDFIAKTGYHAYEPMTGLVIFRPFVCIITNFLHGVRMSFPAGLLTWGATICVAQPAGMLMLAEASREGAWGLIRYSILLAFLAQFMAISVVFPALWIPSACFGRGSGSLSPSRIFVAVLVNLPCFVLSVIVFILPHESSLWNMAAGLLGGPVIALLPSLLWPLPKPLLSNDRNQYERGQRVLVNGYVFTGFIAFVTWWYLLWTAFQTYDSITNLLDDVWMSATPYVAVMFVDAVALYLGLLMYLVFLSGTTFRSAVIWLPLLGPGASAALALASFEIDRLQLPNDKKKQ